VVARLCHDEGLPPFTAGAVGALVEHGARVAAEAGKLTARFGRIADIAREAAFRARQRAVPHVGREDVSTAVLHGKRRADLPGRRFRERVAQDVVHIETEGARVGQVNGLAVIQAGPLTYGFPSRITATVGPGTSGAVHIEREALLSGQIHTKGFLILRGLLRYLLRSRRPLVFDASVTHEQSYGGIDGDSASGAELCCLISALTELPVRQGLAMTGAIDQHGRILPVGAVDEKIEGFFDTCQVTGLTGRQGVIVPRANVLDLQLRRDVTEACRAGRFAVYAVDDVRQALELFMERPAGELDTEGRYAETSVLGTAVRRVEVLWEDAWPEKKAAAEGH
jgi:ATP-dependent Lon protease